MSLIITEGLGWSRFIIARGQATQSPLDPQIGVPYPERTYPHGHEEYIALGQDIFARWFDSTQKVVVYWVTAPETPDIVGYYDTVSAANVAAAAAETSGLFPKMEVNWWHEDMPQLPVGPVLHPDGREDLPGWYDADPEY